MSPQPGEMPSSSAWLLSGMQPLPGKTPGKGVLERPLMNSSSITQLVVLVPSSTPVGSVLGLPAATQPSYSDFVKSW